MREYDLVVIGGGNSGLAAAYGVVSAGKRVALVERGPVGGLCSLAGCNPKKVFVRATEVLEEVRDAGQHGISTNGLSMAWRRVWERKHQFTDPVAESTERSLASAGIELLHGEARFTAPDTLLAGGSELRASGFVIATGSYPRKLRFPGAEYLKISDDILELQQPPARMVIVGAGVVAFEFGHVFARLGTKVTMVMRSTRALKGFDDDFSTIAVGFASKHLGIEFITDADVSSVEQTGSGLLVHILTGSGAIMREADFVLNAAGRVPAIETLNLAAAGVEVGAKGVVVDSFLRSPSNRRVFAGGDAHGVYQLSPVASYEGRIIARNFLRGDTQQADYLAIPHAVFTVPPLASVGMTEAGARERGLEVEVRRHDMTNWKVFAIAGVPIAGAKVILEAGTRRILGAQLLGEGAAEDIHVFALALRARLTADDLKDMVYVYPTFASTIPSMV